MYEAVKSYVGLGVSAAALVLFSGCTESGFAQRYVKLIQYSVGGRSNTADKMTDKKENETDEHGKKVRDELEKDVPFPGVRANRHMVPDNLGSRVSALTNSK